jgi:ketosteroid isomerase-like protein
MASEESAEAVRQEITVKVDSRRTLAESLALRFPRLTTALLRGTWRVVGSRSPASRVRRLAIRNFARRGTDALNRGDLDPFLVFAHPDIEAVNTPGLVGLGGFEARTVGRDAFIEGERHWEAQWETFRYEPTELFDLGDDRFLLLGRVSAHGSASGVVVDSEWGLLATISEGLIIREENFLDRAEALRAAGLPSSN